MYYAIDARRAIGTRTALRYAQANDYPPMIRDGQKQLAEHRQNLLRGERTMEQLSIRIF